MRQATPPFKREVAVKSFLIASTLVCIVALLGQSLATKYRISLEATRIAGGLVLLISALKIMFADPKPPKQEAPKPTALQVATSPLAMPIIVPPAGVAAILISVSLAFTVRGSGIVIALALLTMMVLDFLIMYFNDQVVRLPGLLLLLHIFGAVLIFIQVALAVKVLLSAFRVLETVG